MVKNCYCTFIESVLLYNLGPLYHLLTVECKQQLEKVVKSASKLGNLALDTIDQTVAKRIRVKALKLFMNNNPALTFERLPSGRLRTTKPRTNLMKNSFKTKAVHIINDICF